MLDGEPTSSCIDHINYRLNQFYSASSAVILDKLADHYFTAMTISRKTQVTFLLVYQLEQTMRDLKVFWTTGQYKEKFKRLIGMP